MNHIFKNLPCLETTASVYPQAKERAVCNLPINIILSVIVNASKN